jgi:hypothetical protein
MTTSHIAVLTIVALLLLVGSTVFPQPMPDRGETTEIRMHLQNARPSDVAKRFAVLGGLPSGSEYRVRFTPEDSARTLIVQILPEAGSRMEKDRLRFVIEDAIARFDTMEVKIPLSLYVVRTDLITEEEFVTLDRHFRKGMLDLRSGENAKGVVFRTDFELTEMDIAKFNDTQMERLGKTQPEPVTAKGNVMAARRPSNKLFLSVDLSISKGAMEAKGDTPRELNIVGDAAFSEEGVVVFAGGELRAFKEQPPAYPARHEVMVYVLANKDSISEER